MADAADLIRLATDPPVLRQEATPADWPTMTAAESGFPVDLGARVDKWWHDAGALNLHGLVVVRHGRLVLERYGTGPDFSWGKAYGEVAFGPATLHDVRSVTKSVVGLLYGIALADGRVADLSNPLHAQFPEYPELPARPDLTIEHALTMTLGLDWDETVPYTSAANGEIAMMLAPDRWQYVLTRPTVAPPGTRWIYAAGATELLARLVAKGTGMPLHEYARRALFDPLGIGSTEWLAGHDGVAAAASGLRLAPRDLARIGQAVLDGDVIPRGWREAMLRPYTETDWGAGYGYQWYVDTVAGHRWVGGIGNGGQRLYVFPDLELVVVLTGGNYDGDDSAAQSLVADVLLAT